MLACFSVQVEECGWAAAHVSVSVIAVLGASSADAFPGQSVMSEAAR